MRKSKMKRLKKLEYAFTHGCDVQSLEPFYDIKQGTKPAYYKWCSVHSIDYLRTVFVRNVWLRVVPKEGVAYCDVVETR